MVNIPSLARLLVYEVEDSNSSSTIRLKKNKLSTKLREIISFEDKLYKI